MSTTATRVTAGDSLGPSAVPPLTDEARERRSYGWVVVAAVATAVLVAFRQHTSLPATLGSTWTQVIMIVCGLAWVISRIYRDPDENRHDGAWLFGLAFYSASALSWGLAAMRGVPLGSDRATMDLALLGDTINLLFFGFLLTNLVSLRAVLLLIQTVVASTAVSAVYALIDLFTGVDIAAMIRPPLTRGSGETLAGDLVREGIARTQGASGHPLEFATVAATVLPLSIGLVFAMQARGRRTWPWLVCSGILMLGVVTSLSRSSLLGAGLAVVVMALFWTRERGGQVLKVAAVVAVLVVAAKPSVLTSFLDVFLQSGTDDSIYSRQFGAEFAFRWWTQTPWFGIGHSAYGVPYYPVLDNQYLGRLVQDGLLGLITLLLLWVGALVVALRAAAHLPRTATDEALALRELAVGLMGTMTVVLFSNVVLDTFGFRQVSALTWYLVALCWAVKRLALPMTASASRD